MMRTPMEVLMTHPATPEQYLLSLIVHSDIQRSVYLQPMSVTHLHNIHRATWPHKCCRVRLEDTCLVSGYALQSAAQRVHMVHSYGMVHI